MAFHMERATALELLAAAPRMFLGGLDRFKRYRRMAVSSAVLTAADAFPHHCDGEPETPVTRIEVTVDPKALNVLVPRATADDPRGPFGPG
jgi:diacylglycerol kinase family enzyme